MGYCETTPRTNIDLKTYEDNAILVLSIPTSHTSPPFGFLQTRVQVDGLSSTLLMHGIWYTYWWASLGPTQATSISLHIFPYTVIATWSILFKSLILVTFNNSIAFVYVPEQQLHVVEEAIVVVSADCVSILAVITLSSTTPVGKNVGIQSREIPY